MEYVKVGEGKGKEVRGCERDTDEVSTGEGNGDGYGRRA
jgi:hypothetical protein